MDRLTILGRVNDISVMGSKPIAILLAIILEKGFLVGNLDRIVHRVANTCREAGVYIVTGGMNIPLTKIKIGVFSRYLLKRQRIDL